MSFAKKGSFGSIRDKSINPISWKVPPAFIPNANLFSLERFRVYEKSTYKFEKVRKSLNSYLLANMTEFGKSDLINYKELENLGYNIVIYPVTTQRLAMKSVEEGLKVIFKDGHQKNVIDKMQTRSRLYDLVDYKKYNSLDKKIYNFNTDGHK